MGLLSTSPLTPTVFLAPSCPPAQDLFDSDELAELRAYAAQLAGTRQEDLETSAADWNTMGYLFDDDKLFKVQGRCRGMLTAC